MTKKKAKRRTSKSKKLVFPHEMIDTKTEDILEAPAFSGRPKARAAETFLPDHKGWVFVADGFGDIELAGLTHRRDGLVVSVAGNLDISSEPKQFAAMADIRLESPTELVGALYYAALTRAWTSGSREFPSQTLYEFPS